MKTKNEMLPLANEKIRFDRVQLITFDGKNIGIIPTNEALKAAYAQGLDLVIIAEKGADGVPVAKVMDLGKSLYEKKKQQSDAKKHQKVIQIKELKIRPKISEHDYQTKINQAIDFLKDGKHVKVTLMFKGREAAMAEERGTELLRKIDESFQQAGLLKIAQEKDSRTGQMWSRIYFLKK